MKILTLITARGGSKRLPGKNIRLLGGKPLVVWSIDVVKGISEICGILISTDDLAIADVARKAGAVAPWLRPTELASDTASSVSVCLHALDWYESQNGKVDGLLLLQPTSPLRRKETVIRGIELFRSHQYRSVIGIAPAKSHPMWCFQIDGETMRPFIGEKAMHKRYQDLQPAYVVNGSFYLIAPEDLRKKQSFYSDDMVPLVIDNPEENIDIDTEWDWKIAEMALQAYNLN